MTYTRVDGSTASRLAAAFYLVVALTALAGQTEAAMTWLHWPLPLALAAVAALELGGIALAAWADYRRRLGERAIPARALSAAVVAFAVGFQAVGHADTRQAAFFAGMSALGYAVYLIQAAARRRDHLRAAGMLPAPPPVYGLAQWIRQPRLTRRARALAVADPSLGLYGSLSAAAEQWRTERRRAAMADLLKRKLSEGRDKLAAEIAVTTYDLDEVAARLDRMADYDGLARLLAVDLDPVRLTTAATLDDTSEELSDEADMESDENTADEQRQRGGQPLSLEQRAVRLWKANKTRSAAEIARHLSKPEKPVDDRTVRRWLKPHKESAAVSVNGAEVPDMVTADA